MTPPVTVVNWKKEDMKKDTDLSDVITTALIQYTKENPPNQYEPKKRRELRRTIRRAGYKHVENTAPKQYSNDGGLYGVLRDKKNVALEEMASRNIHNRREPTGMAILYIPTSSKATTKILVRYLEAEFKKKYGREFRQTDTVYATDHTITWIFLINRYNYGSFVKNLKEDVKEWLYNLNQAWGLEEDPVSVAIHGRYEDGLSDEQVKIRSEKIERRRRVDELVLEKTARKKRA